MKSVSTKVINLTELELSAGEIETLLLGLTLPPTPRWDYMDFERDIFQFSRKLRLRYLFAGKTNPDPSLLKQPSTFTPKRGTSFKLENLVKPKGK